MRIELHVFHHFPQDNAPAWVDRVIKRVELMESRVMSKIEDKVAELNSVLETQGASIVSLKGSVIGLTGDIESQTAEIIRLKDELAAAGTLTPEQEALFDAVISKNKEQASTLTDQATMLADLDAKNPATGGGVGNPTPDA